LHEGKAVSQPEIDSVLINVTVLSESSVADELESKIRSVMESDLVQAKWIGQIERFINQMSSLCGVYYAIDTIYNGVLAVEAAILAIADIVGLGSLAGVIKPYVDSIGWLQSTLYYIQITCDIVTCQYAGKAISEFLGSGEGEDWLAALFSGQNLAALPINYVSYLCSC